MKLIYSLAFLLLTTSAFAQKLVVKVENIKDNEGQVAVALFNKKEDFPKNRFQGKMTPAKKGEVEVIFENLPAGEYAISVLHDTNKNEKMDSNLFGMPKEGYGFSNNAMGTMGPPSFEKAKFTLTSNPVIIKMKY